MQIRYLLHVPGHNYTGELDDTVTFIFARMFPEKKNKKKRKNPIFLMISILAYLYSTKKMELGGMLIKSGINKRAEHFDENKQRTENIVPKV